MSAHELGVINSTGQAAATCVVCGKDVAAGAGVTAQFDGRILRFRCPGCLTRFSANPERYLSGGSADCCEGEGHAT